MAKTDSSLIEVNAAFCATTSVLHINRRSHPMPNDTVILAMIVGAFSVFAATLLWADLFTRKINR
jgi:hypothetical protein